MWYTSIYDDDVDKHVTQTKSCYSILSLLIETKYLFNILNYMIFKSFAAGCPRGKLVHYIIRYKKFTPLSLLCQISCTLCTACSTNVFMRQKIESYNFIITQTVVLYIYVYTIPQYLKNLNANKIVNFGYKSFIVPYLVAHKMSNLYLNCRTFTKMYTFRRYTWYEIVKIKIAISLQHSLTSLYNVIYLV